jgi:hypothetical protein
MKEIILYLSIIVIVVLCGVPGISAGEKSYSDERIYAKAEIIKIEKTELAETLFETRIHLKILDGIFAGKTRTAVFKGEDVTVLFS